MSSEKYFWKNIFRKICFSKNIFRKIFLENYFSKNVLSTNILKAQTTTEEITTEFFKTYEKSPQKAVDYVFGTNKWMMDRNKDGIENVKTHLTSFLGLVGDYYGYEKRYLMLGHSQLLISRDKDFNKIVSVVPLEGGFCMIQKPRDFGGITIESTFRKYHFKFENSVELVDWYKKI